MKHLIETDGKASGTKAWFSACSAIVLVKYAVSGVTIAGFTGGDFDAAGASMLIVAFGSLYFGRRNVKIGGGHGD